MIAVLDYAIVLTFFSRLYVRRLADNTFNSVSLSRAISNDVSKHLLEVGAEGFADNIAKLLNSVFQVGENTPETFKRILKTKLSPQFVIFFKNADSSTKAFIKLAEAIQHEITQTVNDLCIHAPEATTLSRFSHLAAKVITDELANAFATDAQKCERGYQADQTPEAFQALLGQMLMKSVAARYTSEYTRQVKDTLQQLKLALPIKDTPVCECNLTKILHAGISSPIYYAGNHLILGIPAVLHALGYLSSANFYFIEKPAMLLTILTYGQNFNEYKVTEGRCTRHRYRVFARNKAHSLGVGLAFFLTWQALIQAVALTTGVDNFFTKDALVNILMQVGTTSMLSYRERLPGKKKFPTDIFMFPRAMTLSAVNFVKWVLTRDAEDKEEHDNALVTIQSALISKRFRDVITVILGGSNLLPPHDFLFFGLTDDPRRVLAQVRSFKVMIDFYRSDIDYVIRKIKEIYKYSTWVASPLLSLPAPGILTLIVEVLQLMKNSNWDELIQNHEFERFLTFFPKDTLPNETLTVIEPQQEINEAHIGSTPREVVVPPREIIECGLSQRPNRMVVRQLSVSDHDSLLATEDSAEEKDGVLLVVNASRSLPTTALEKALFNGIAVNSENYFSLPSGDTPTIKRTLQATAICPRNGSAPSLPISIPKLPSLSSVRRLSIWSGTLVTDAFSQGVSAGMTALGVSGSPPSASDHKGVELKGFKKI
jgi:hypothetical protein